MTLVFQAILVVFTVLGVSIFVFPIFSLAYLGYCALPVWRRKSEIEEGGTGHQFAGYEPGRWREDPPATLARTRPDKEAAVDLPRSEFTLGFVFPILRLMGGMGSTE